MAQNKKEGLTPDEKNEAVEIMGLRSPQIYEVVRKEGVEELSRPMSSLFWSGLVAGLALSLSLYCKAFLHSELEGHALQAVLSNIGYTVGFIIVIMGRLQLFTENTISVVLPVLGDCSVFRVGQTFRLWGVVLFANLLGVLISTLCAYYGSIIPEKQVLSALEISKHLVEYSAMKVFLLGIPAGFLMAAIVWLLPSSKGNEFWVISLLTYMIAIGGLTHVVVGSAEWSLLALDGVMTWGAAISGGILPALAGNILGGTGLFALISYGQVRNEL